MKTLNKSARLCYVNGDIFTDARNIVNNQLNRRSIIIPHVCNNMNSYAAGFAAAVAEEFPLAKENYHMLVLRQSLGYSQFIKVHEKNKNSITIANMICQNGFRNKTNNRPLNYANLVICMYKVKQYAIDLQKSIKDEQYSVEIYCPKFGSGLAGGKWDFIEDLIKDLWTDQFNVYVYNK